MAEVATAFVTLMPSAKGFGRNTERAIAGDVDQAGKRSGSKFGLAMSGGVVTALAGGALAIGGLVKSAVGLEASFSKTMNVLQATTNASGAEMKSLSALAIQMGADTVFSAGDASQAMLELARGGITPANIEAGALAGTLTLAAAGELEMGEAANIAVKAMGQFNLQGKDMNSIAAALAGGANASSSSVQDLAQALSQTGLAANSVGFSIQDTTAILASFSNQGLEGSDAGTSLKTMLDRLQPSTESASSAFKELGLFNEETGSAFVKSNGEFKSATQIAGLLQRATEGLSDAESKRLITQAFGSDAQRAATALANEGATGLRNLIRQTSDQGAAEKTAAANMKGTAGALEQLSGAWETLRLSIGLAIKPFVIGFLRGLAAVVGGLVPGVQKLGAAISNVGSGGGGGSLSTIADAFRGIGQAYADYIRDLLPTLQKVGGQIAKTLGPAFRDLGVVLRDDLMPALREFLPVVAPIAKVLLIAFGATVVGAIKGATIAIRAFVKIVSGVMNIISGILDGDWKRVWLGARQVVVGSVGAILGPVRAIGNGIARVFGLTNRNTTAQWRAMWIGIRGVTARSATVVRNTVARVAAAILVNTRNFTRQMVASYRNGFTIVSVVVRNSMRVTRAAVASALGAMRSIVAGALGRIRSSFSSAWSSVRGATTSAFRSIRSAVSDGISDAVSTVRGFPGKARAALGGLGSVLFGAGAELVQGLINGIQSRIAALGAKMADLASKVRGFLPGSPVKEGPLTSWNNGGAGKRLIDLLAQGLGSTRPVDAAMTRLSSRMQVASIGTRVGVVGEGIGARAGDPLAGRSVTLVVDGRPMRAWFEESFDNEMSMSA